MTVESTRAEQKAFYKQWNNALPVIMRTLVWCAIFALLYLLRSFFLLIFLTFVFSYIQANGVRRLEPKIKSRPVRVVLVAAIFLLVILGTGAFIVPSVKQQAKVFADRYPSYLITLDQELIQLLDQYPALEDMLAIHLDERPDGSPELPEGRKSLSATLIQQLLGLDEADEQGNIKQTLDILRNIGGYLLTLGSAFLLALLFSFLIVLDLPKLSKSATELANTKLNFIYTEVAGSIRDFGAVLGRALEAQLVIAILNTGLTAIGLVLLGLTDKMAFVSLIVFLCSFIPVAGVFISSVPICLLALQASGVALMLLAILMIVIIHLIEAYILNPRIYGHHLRMNPVIVLIILTIGGKMFGVWGFLLGVPVFTYIFGHAIRYTKDDESLIASS